MCDQEDIGSLVTQLCVSYEKMRSTPPWPPYHFVTRPPVFPVSWTQSATDPVKREQNRSLHPCRQALWPLASAIVLLLTHSDMNQFIYMAVMSSLLPKAMGIEQWALNLSISLSLSLSLSLSQRIQLLPNLRGAQEQKRDKNPG
ncbi:hypothetical protein JZ751_030036, partial [Albula glossodonta]